MCYPAECAILCMRIIRVFSSWFDSNVEVRVKDLNLELAMSTVIGLVDLAEDEIIGKPLPAEVNYA